MIDIPTVILVPYFDRIHGACDTSPHDLTRRAGMTYAIVAGQVVAPNRTNMGTLTLDAWRQLSIVVDMTTDSDFTVLSFQTADAVPAGLTELGRYRFTNPPVDWFGVASVRSTSTTATMDVERVAWSS